MTTKAFETATPEDRALTGSDILEAFENVRIKKEDLRFVNRAGDCNVVARVRKTRKGEKGLGTTAGVNGSVYYVIRLGVDGKLYCTLPSTNRPCPSFTFKKGLDANGHCKHVRALLASVRELVASGVNQNTDIIIYNAKAILAAA